MGAFVLVTAGRSERSGQITPPDVFEKLMLLLLTEGFWPHGDDSLDVGELHPNDAVLFCLADDAAPLIVGDAVVAARSTRLTPQRAGQIHMYLGAALPADPLAFTHSVVLTQLNIWREPRPCAADGDPAEAEVVAALQSRARTGVIRPISGEAFERLAGHPMPEAPHDQPCALESKAEAAAPHAANAKQFVLGNWPLVDFGEPLRPFNGARGGKSVTTPAGPIDLLCEAQESGDLVAVMWANGEPPMEVLAAAQERLAWLRHDVGDDGRRVRGLILTIDESHDLDADDIDDLEVRRVRVWCEPMGQPDAYGSDPETLAGNLAAQAVLVRAGRVGHNPARSPDLDFAAKCLRVPRSRRLRED